MSDSDCGIYRAGEPLPEHWFAVSQRPDSPPMHVAPHSFTFANDTEVTFKDGWLRLHLLSADRHDGAWLAISACRNADLHFTFDMQIFDPDGQLLSTVTVDPTASFELRDQYGRPGA